MTEEAGAPANLIAFRDRRCRWHWRALAPTVAGWDAEWAAELAEREQDKSDRLALFGWRPEEYTGQHGQA